MENSVEPRDAAQLGEFIYTKHQAAQASRRRAIGPGWAELDCADQAVWREVAREVYERFAPASAPDEPICRGRCGT